MSLEGDTRTSLNQAACATGMRAVVPLAASPGAGGRVASGAAAVQTPCTAGSVQPSDTDP